MRLAVFLARLPPLPVIMDFPLDLSFAGPRLERIEWMLADIHKLFHDMNDSVVAGYNCNATLPPPGLAPCLTVLGPAGVEQCVVVPKSPSSSHARRLRDKRTRRRMWCALYGDSSKEDSPGGNTSSQKNNEVERFGDDARDGGPIRDVDGLSSEISKVMQGVDAATAAVCATDVGVSEQILLAQQVVASETVSLAIGKMEEKFCANVSRIRDNFAQLTGLLEGIPDTSGNKYHRVQEVIQKQVEEVDMLQEALEDTCVNIAADLYTNFPHTSATERMNKFRETWVQVFLDLRNNGMGPRPMQNKANEQS